jgi:hypothetical protein
MNNHIRAIVDMPSIPKESLTALRKINENATKHLRSLKLMGEPTDMWDSIIIYIIVSKLDPQSLVRSGKLTM